MKSRPTRRQFVCSSATGVAVGLALPQWSMAQSPQGPWSFENQYFKHVVGPDARSIQFVDKQTGQDHCGGDGKASLARVKKGGRQYEASSAQFSDGCLSLGFGDSGVQAVLKPTVHAQHLVWEVLAVNGEGVEELTLIDIPLKLAGAPQEPFSACALALNLRTNVEENPQPSSRLRATCYPRFGMVGAKVALVAAPSGKLRVALQEAVSAAEELPHSPLGGPWAMDQAINHGSYLFNFGDMTLEKADGWIELAKSLGMNQIDFHGGGSFRFGDCRPNPVTYPEGFKSLKAVIDKLHGAGIAAGLHTYAFFIARDCPWVTPVPDPRLASDATLTLAADLAADAVLVPVVESTAAMSATTGFYVHNSVTVRIENELIVYTDVAKEAPFAFTGCKRGAYGTQAVAHPKGAKVVHLKECFGLFVPDPETTLFEEVAACTAEAFNACGFDMIYLDALDGEGILGGHENAWHYGSRFVYEICKRLKKPALMEMSTFHHHLWCVRSRLGAWDHPNRSYKRFIDSHCAGNVANRRMFLPGQFGWWALKNWTGIQSEPTFSDDIEYLMAKCLGTDTGLALMGINPDSAKGASALPRLGSIIRRYEDLRHSGKVPDAIKLKLRVVGDEFTLIGSLEEGWQFRPIQCVKHKVECAEPWSSQWKVTNRFGAQPLRLRIEALMAAGPYDAPGNLTLADFRAADDFSIREAASLVTADWKPSKDLPANQNVLATGPTGIGDMVGCLSATNGRSDRLGAWAKLAKKYTPTLNLSGHQAMGLWVHGDGQGEILNLQWMSPAHLVSGIGDHYITIDFTGWRYFELIEPEGERFADYQWPYAGGYAIYREAVQLGQIETLGLWYNNLPPEKPVSCLLIAVKAMPLVSATLSAPRITIGSQTLTLPVEIPTGHYLELLSPEDCKLYGPNGELVRKVELPGAIPVLESGENTICFQAQTQPGLRLRAQVTVFAQGEAL